MVLWRNWIRLVQWVIAAGQMIASARVHFTLQHTGKSTRWVRALASLYHTLVWAGASVHVQELGSDNVCGKRHEGGVAALERYIFCKWLQPADKSIALEHNELIFLLMQLATKCCSKQGFTLFHFFQISEPNKHKAIVKMQSVKKHIADTWKWMGKKSIYPFKLQETQVFQFTALISVSSCSA